MRVIVPAAGTGRRLLPYTATLPKCLLSVGGLTLAERLLGQLRAAGVGEVVFVLGHGAEFLERHVAGVARRPPVRFVNNPDYERSNSIVSLAATVALWDEEFAIVDSDVLVSSGLLGRLLRAPGNAMVIDTQRPRESIDMAVELRNGAVWDLAKDMPTDRISGEAVPLSRWSVAGGARLGQVLSRMIADGATDVWYQYAIREVAKETHVAALPARSHEWFELDHPDDLTAAASAYARAS
jgi:L-glutamine-phosphate cytidylyltransferase